MFSFIKVKYAIDRPTYFAELLHGAISGPGTRDSTLQRILTLRADVSKADEAQYII